MVEDNGGFQVVTLASNRHTLSGGHLLDTSAATQPQWYVPSQPCATRQIWNVGTDFADIID